MISFPHIKGLKLVAKLRLVLLTVFLILCLHCALCFQVAIMHWTVHWLKSNIFPFVKMFRKRPLGVNWQATSLILICGVFLLPLLLSGFYLHFVIREGEMCWLHVAFKLVCEKVPFFLKKDSCKMLSNIKNARTGLPLLCVVITGMWQGRGNLYIRTLRTQKKSFQAKECIRNGGNAISLIQTFPIQNINTAILF